MFCQICGEWSIGVRNFSPGLFCQLCKVLHRQSDPKFIISFWNCLGKSRLFLHISNVYDSFLKNQKLCSGFISLVAHRFWISNFEFWILNIEYLLFFLHASAVEKIKTVIQNSTLLNRWAAEVIRLLNCQSKSWNYGYQTSTVLLYFCCDKRQIWLFLKEIVSI